MTVGAFAVGAGVLAGTAAAQNEDIVIYGIVRDFRADHADFGVSGSAAHVAGNVAPTLSSHTPVFTGAGFGVGTQWTNSSSQPIAPHMYMVGSGPAVQVASAPTMDNNSYADTYDPALGPYGGSNKGPAPSFVIDPAMPTVTEPAGLPTIGEWKRDSNGGTTVVSNSFNCEKFLVGNHHTVHISGDVEIIVRDEFKIQNFGRIELLPGATFSVYARNVFTIQDQSVVGDPADHSRVGVYITGTEPLILQNQVELHAAVVAPGAQILAQDGSDFFGSFIGKDVFLKNKAGFHIAGELASSCGFVVADSAGAWSTSDTGRITSANTFHQWFTTAPGHNAATAHPITLADAGGGFRQFRSSAFYPIDGHLYGNQGHAHNRNFTFMLRTEFVFSECSNQIIEMQGSDDIWVYVNDELVIDLGGIGANQKQVAEIDRLGLADGERARLTVFYAHRSGATPALSIRTNLDIDPLTADIARYHGWD